MLCALVGAACTTASPRAQSHYLRVENLTVIPTGPDSGHIKLDLRSTRQLTPLSTLIVEAVCPEGRRWRHEQTVTAGPQRYAWLTPQFHGLSAGETCLMRVTALGPDRVTRVDALGQFVAWPEAR